MLAPPPPPPAPRPRDSAADRIASAFDARAEGYDTDLSYHGPLADALLARAAPRPSERVLDVACGTGLVALAAAAAVGPSGRVVGLDLSGGMLEQARAKATAAGTAGWTEWVQADAEDHEFLQSKFSPGSFDLITCSSAIPFLRDPFGALRRWHEWLDPQRGRVAFNAFEAPAVLDFGTFCTVAARHGVTVPDPCSNLGSEARVTAALSEAGFTKISVKIERKERRFAATSPREYAEKMWAMGTTINPFCQVDESVLGGARDAFEALHADVIAGVEAAAADRWEPAAAAGGAAGCVRSPYTVLHVLAHA